MNFGASTTLLTPMGEEDRQGPRGIRAGAGANLRHGFYDTVAVKQVYYPEVIRLLKRATGASEVDIFDHTLRIEDEAKRRALGTRSPVSFVHNDYTERSGPERARTRHRRLSGSSPDGLPSSMSGDRLEPLPKAFRWTPRMGAPWSRRLYRRRHGVPGPHRRDLPERPFR